MLWMSIQRKKRASRAKNEHPEQKTSILSKRRASFALEVPRGSAEPQADEAWRSGSSETAIPDPPRRHNFGAFTHVYSCGLMWGSCGLMWGSCRLKWGSCGLMWGSCGLMWAHVSLVWADMGAGLMGIARVF